MTAKTILIDAHNHLQDPRLKDLREDCIADWRRLGVARTVVNGTAENDWPAVADLAANYPEVIPSFGLHPWFIRNRSDEWLTILENQIKTHPGAGVGEIGLDKWIRNHWIEEQETIFRDQLRLAATWNRPATIHCLKAWGRLLKVLKEELLPDTGFLLHSFAGPTEMIDSLAELGGYFSFSGHFLHDRKSAVRAAFREVPTDRLLIETDAPDMRLPSDEDPYSAISPTGEPINHPGNIAGIYAAVARIRKKPLEELAHQVRQNFERLFRADSTC